MVPNRGHHHPTQRAGSGGARLDLQVDQAPVVPVPTRMMTRVQTHFCGERRTAQEEEEEEEEEQEEKTGTPPRLHPVCKTSLSKSEERSTGRFIYHADIRSVAVVSVRG